MESAMTSAENRPVVAGIDGTRTWPAVVDLAVAEAVRRTVPLLIVHAWPGRYAGRPHLTGRQPPGTDRDDPGRRRPGR